jgi:hypothetical protein
MQGIKEISNRIFGVIEDKQNEMLDLYDQIFGNLAYYITHKLGFKIRPEGHLMIASPSRLNFESNPVSKILDANKERIAVAVDTWFNVLAGNKVDVNAFHMLVELFIADNNLFPFTLDSDLLNVSCDIVTAPLTGAVYVYSQWSQGKDITELLSKWKDTLQKNGHCVAYNQQQLQPFPFTLDKLSRYMLTYTAKECLLNELGHPLCHDPLIETTGDYNETIENRWTIKDDAFLSFERNNGGVASCYDVAFKPTFLSGNEFLFVVAVVEAFNGEYLAVSFGVVYNKQNEDKEVS